jgi:hypothetical protein
MLLKMRTKKERPPTVVSIPWVFRVVGIEPEIAVVGIGLVVDLQIRVVERLEILVEFGVVARFVEGFVRVVVGVANVVEVGKTT